jgi:6-phosphofructokinase 1
MVLEVFGRYAGFTAMLPTLAGAAHRCVIPEYPFDMERLAELLCQDRMKNPSRYSIVLVSEGATIGGDRVFAGAETDAYGHARLGGIGEVVGQQLTKLSPKFNNGRVVNTINQRLGYLVRCGDPDAIDSIVPMAYGSMALDLVMRGQYGRLVVLQEGRYTHIPIEAVTATKKLVNVEKHYNKEELCPYFRGFENYPLLIMASE